MDKNSFCIPLFVCKARGNLQREDDVIILVSAQRNLRDGVMPPRVTWVSVAAGSSTGRLAACPFAGH